MITTPGEHRHIPLHQLQASPFNRKRFDAAKMAELTQNVGLQGIIVPIVARPLPAGGGFEIVAGERRYRAAKAAGLVDIPAIVRELTDAQALELQVIENGQREDVHPLEEAEGYERLMKCAKTDGTQYTADDIALKVGKSRSYVFNRLKLTAMCPEAREAFFADKIDASKGLLIARIGHHDTQRQALKDITGGRYGGDNPMSYREAHQHILQTYMLKLSAAPFDIKDAGLNVKAGACGPCPKAHRESSRTLQRLATRQLIIAERGTARASEVLFK
jgi:ParB/RepB/Spo0J family partition protein